MVYTYYEIGRMIVEDEQQGKDRAEYGKKVLKELSKQLTMNFGKGFSEDNLGRMKNFYLMYSKQISATTLRKSGNSSISAYHVSQELPEDLAVSRFHLSWSHFLKLMRINNQSERSFYEIECIKSNWNLRELQR